MNTRQINFAEAVELCKIKDADFYPFACINDDGVVNLKQFIAQYAEEPENHVICVWANDAESAALNLLNGYDAFVEMSSAHTYNKIPATLKFEASDFNWFI